MLKWVACQLDRGRSIQGQAVLTESALGTLHASQIRIEQPNPLVFQGLGWLGSVPEYGLGWCIGSVRGRRALFHPGYIDGYSATVVLVPEEGLGVIALANANLSDAPAAIAQVLVEGMLEETPDLAGRFDHPEFGALAVASRGGEWALEYRGRTWPLRRKEDGGYECVVTAFGLPIPMPVVFGFSEAGRAASVSLPLAMDPRVAPAKFTLAE
jgi:CubicO group peptidase (beta-lactamase class C family)